MKSSFLVKCFLPWREFKYQVGRQHRQAFFSLLLTWTVKIIFTAISNWKITNTTRSERFSCKAQPRLSWQMDICINSSPLQNRGIYCFKKKKSVSINLQQFTLKCWSAISTFQTSILPHQSATKEGKAEYCLASPKTETYIGERFEREACGAFWF